MNSSVAANFTDSPEQCTVHGFILFRFQVTTGVLVLGILSCLLDVVGILTAVPGNLLVILAICLNSSLHHNANYVLLVLAVSDLLIGALLQPVFFINKIQHLLGRPSCTTANVFQVIFPIVRNASIVSEMLVSLERTIAVMAPYWYEEWVTPRRLFAAPACVWFVWTLVVHTSLFWARFDEKAILLLSGALMAACLLVTTVCYGLLVKVANHHENQIQVQQQQVQRSEEEKKKIKRERKALWTAIYINGAYFAGYLPIVSAVVITATVNLSAKKVFLLRSWLGSLGCLIAGVNPIILSWRNTRVGTEMRKLLRFNNGNNEAVQPHVQPPS